MKYAWLPMILTLILNDPMRIRKINTAKAEARKSFQAGDYKEAVKKYTYLIDSLGVKEDEVLLNRAHAWYLEKDTANAYTAYQALAQSVKKEITSKANNQLGLITNLQGKAEEALRHFKMAVKADPSNEDARYNYEMLKKKLDQKNKEEQKKKDQEQNKDKNKNQEPSDFAKRLKAEADRLVAERKYKAAFDLMNDGLKKDETVSTYQDYIKRLKDVTDINR
jgi:hypothetical protein